MDKRPLGTTGHEVGPICIGASPLGIPYLYGGRIDFDAAVVCVHAIFDGTFDFLDTANGYGESERQIGRAIEERGGLPPGFLLATKVDPAPGSTDFSGERVPRPSSRSATKVSSGISGSPGSTSTCCGATSTPAPSRSCSSTTSSR
jgi:D-threo-aldose 1-dehydrogenase